MGMHIEIRGEWAGAWRFTVTLVADVDCHRLYVCTSYEDAIMVAERCASKFGPCPVVDRVAAPDDLMV